jgi:hypothetical protein
VVKEWLRKYWRRIAITAVVAGLLIGGGLVLVAAGTKPARSDFTVTADTGILRLHTYCAQRLVWDLPPGIVSQPVPMQPQEDVKPGAKNKIDKEEEEKPDGHISVAMEGNLFITISRAATGALMVVIQRGEGDETGDPLGTVTISNPIPGSKEMERRSQVITEKLYYRSVAGPKPTFTLPLWGHVIVGDDVPQGSGSAAGAAPLLQAATIRARVSLSGSLNEGVPRKTVINEVLDAGDIVDTHPTLSDQEMNKAAVAALCGPEVEDWAAVGFVTPEKDGFLTAVVHRNAEALSVTRASAKPFVLSVPKWHKWFATPGWQGTIIALLLIAWIVSNFNNAVGLFQKFWPPKKQG